jgi:hypothetical protein
VNTSKYEVSPKSSRRHRDWQAHLYCFKNFGKVDCIEVEESHRYFVDAKEFVTNEGKKIQNGVTIVCRVHLEPEEQLKDSPHMSSVTEQQLERKQWAGEIVQCVFHDGEWHPIYQDKSGRRYMIVNNHKKCTHELGPLQPRYKMSSYFGKPIYSNFSSLRDWKIKDFEACIEKNGEFLPLKDDDSTKGSVYLVPPKDYLMLCSSLTFTHYKDPYRPVLLGRRGGRYVLSDSEEKVYLSSIRKDINRDGKVVSLNNSINKDTKPFIQGFNFDTVKVLAEKSIPYVIFRDHHCQVHVGPRGGQYFYGKDKKKRYLCSHANLKIHHLKKLGEIKRETKETGIIWKE